MEDEDKEDPENKLDAFFAKLESDLNVGADCEFLRRASADFANTVRNVLLKAQNAIENKAQQIRAEGGDLNKITKMVQHWNIKMVAFRQTLENHRDALVVKNDGFEATSLFLQAKGLTSTSQLDAAGKEELLMFLENALKSILQNKQD